MGDLEELLVLFVAAVILAAAARRVGAPYPVFLALGGTLLAFLPGAPSLSVPPELALALFVAPVLLDAAYDASLRDLRDNWAPVTGLVVFAVGFTAAAVAVVAHTFIPTMPWAAAIALGAVVAPPDAVAATAVLRPLRVGHELAAARERALRAALASLSGNPSPVAELFRQEFRARLADERANADLDTASQSAHGELHRAALKAARQAVLAMRANDEIGDDAFHRVEEELDWIEMASGQNEQ